MAFTPVEVRHVRLSRRLLGYRRRSVDNVLAEVAESFEGVWRERADLADKVEQLEAELVRYREIEQLLHTALISAERTAHELKSQAKREAQAVVEEAHAEARAITRDALRERELLLGEVRRIRVLLHAALDALDEAGGVESPDEEPEARIEAA